MTRKSGRGADVTITSNIDAAGIVERYAALATFSGDEFPAKRPLALITGT